MSAGVSTAPHLVARERTCSALTMTDGRTTRTRHNDTQKTSGEEPNLVAVSRQVQVAAWQRCWKRRRPAVSFVVGGQRTPRSGKMDNTRVDSSPSTPPQHLPVNARTRRICPLPVPLRPPLPLPLPPRRSPLTYTSLTQASLMRDRQLMGVTAAGVGRGQPKESGSEARGKGDSSTCGAANKRSRSSGSKSAAAAGRWPRKRGGRSAEGERLQ